MRGPVEKDRGAGRGNLVPNRRLNNARDDKSVLRPLIRGGATSDCDATMPPSHAPKPARRMNTLLIATLSGAGVAGACTWLVSAWWHRRRTRSLVAQVVRLDAELDRLRAPRPPGRADAGVRTDGSALRPSMAVPLAALPHRRRLWPTLRSRVRTLRDRRASLSTALPFLDTVASTRHTAASGDPN